jgi:phosphoribosylglycinamide formyltransferase 1
MNIAVFASGRGSNFKAIIAAVKRGYLAEANLRLLISDNPKAGAISIARKAKIETAIFKRSDFASRSDFEAKIITKLEENKIELIVLAGFMRVLSAHFVRHYRNRIIYIHPALLPAFKGGSAIKDAFKYGVKVTGVTVHFVDEETDHGPIILQEALSLNKDETIDSLESRIHKIEHRLYPKAIKLFLQGKLKIKEKRKVQVF